MAMIVTITTFHLKRAASLEEMTKVFQGDSAQIPKYGWAASKKLLDE
jgi:hypothetical protein